MLAATHLMEGNQEIGPTGAVVRAAMVVSMVADLCMGNKNVRAKHRRSKHRTMTANATAKITESQISTGSVHVR